MERTINLNLLSKLRNSEAIATLPKYIDVKLTGKTLPLNLLKCLNSESKHIVNNVGSYRKTGKEKRRQNMRHDSRGKCKVIHTKVYYRPRGYRNLRLPDYETIGK
jgi:hypothetical protein